MPEVNKAVVSWAKAELILGIGAEQALPKLWKPVQSVDEPVNLFIILFKSLKRALPSLISQMSTPIVSPGSGGSFGFCSDQQAIPIPPLGNAEAEIVGVASNTPAKDVNCASDQD